MENTHHCVLQVSQLNTLITHLLGDLTKGDRQKIMTICTIDVHARDVVQKLIMQKVDNAQAFLWLSQLRHRYVRVYTSFIIPQHKVYAMYMLYFLIL